MPPPPGEFLFFTIFQDGTVTVGGQPAPDGSVIEARILWWRSSPATTFGGKYTAIIVNPNDWALQGKTITFHLGDRQATQTAVWDSKTLQAVTLNLTFP